MNVIVKVLPLVLHRRPRPSIAARSPMAWTLSRACGSRGPGQAQAGGGLAAAADLQLLQHVVHVVLDGGGADPELARDLLVGAALRDERQDLALARGQRRQRGRRLEFA